MMPSKVDDSDYIDYLIAAQRNFACTEASRSQHLSNDPSDMPAHDSFNRLLERGKRIPGYRARRWVVERTHSWMNRFRRLLIRWEEKRKNYVAMLHFACAWITWRATGLGR